MRYRLLGKSGLRVSELALGTMTFGPEWGWGADAAECRAIFDCYAGAGGNFLDTADMYTGGTSERLVGELVRAEREHFVVATKYTASMTSDPIAGGNSRRHLIHATEASLQRLGLEAIDVMYVHWWDGTTPLEEILRALDDLIRQGKIHYAGFSNVPAWIVARADLLAELRGWSRFIALQYEYNLINRSIELEVLPMARALGIGVTTFYALGAGVLTGKYRGAGPLVASRMPKEAVPPRSQEIAELVVQQAREAGLTPAQLALAWVLSRQDQAQIVPVVGARNRDQIADSLGAVEAMVDPAILAALDDATKPQPILPYSLIDSELARSLHTAHQPDGLERRPPLV